MSAPFDLHQVIGLAFAAAWILGDLALAGAALYRFRLTGAGLLMGSSLALMSLKNLVSLLLLELVIRRHTTSAIFGDHGDDYDRWLQIQSAFFVGRTAVSFLLLALLAVGILLIPSALRKLADRPADAADLA